MAREVADMRSALATLLVSLGLAAPLCAQDEKRSLTFELYGHSAWTGNSFTSTIVLKKCKDGGYDVWRSSKDRSREGLSLELKGKGKLERQGSTRILKVVFNTPAPSLGASGRLDQALEGAQSKGKVPTHLEATYWIHTTGVITGSVQLPTAQGPPQTVLERGRPKRKKGRGQFVFRPQKPKTPNPLGGLGEALRLPELKLGKQAPQATPQASYTSLPLPVFALAREDLFGGNGILGVFVQQTAQRAEFTVVFGGEDHPFPPMDPLYDMIRRLIYGRAEDLESFSYELSPRGSPLSLSFAGTYTGNQPYYNLIPFHFSTTLAFERFALEKGRPVIHIGTWNHMFSEENRAPNRDVVLVRDYPVYEGSRADCEALFSR